MSSIGHMLSLYTSRYASRGTAKELCLKIIPKL